MASYKTKRTKKTPRTAGEVKCADNKGVPSPKPKSDQVAETVLGPSVTKTSPPSPQELKEKLKAPDNGRRHPLRGLAAAEEALEIRSTALNELANPEREPMDADLLIHQLLPTVYPRHGLKTMAPRVRQGLFRLYKNLGPTDAADAIICQALVALSNSNMEAHARAACAMSAKALAINLRHIENATRTIVHLVEARDRRSGKLRSVRSINVECGAQAIIGDVHAHGPGKDEEEK